MMTICIPPIQCRRSFHWFIVLAVSYTHLVQGFGRVGKLPREMTLSEYAQLVKESLKLNDVKVYGNLDSMVKCAAVLSLIHI